QRATLQDNLYLTLSQRVEPALLDRLNRALSQDAMALPTTAFQLAAQLQLAVDEGDGLDLGGLRIDTRQLTPQFSQKTAAELEDEIQGLIRQLNQQEAQLATALELEQAIA